MKILVSCEESQAVCIELRKLGHNAFSCDIEPCSGGHPEWHIQKDVIPLLNGNCEFNTVDGEYHKIDGRWDMIVAFPPCTYLSNAGARHLYKGGKLNQERYQKGLKAKKFFMSFLDADCPHIAVENPVSSRIYQMPPHTQEIHPWQFGHPVQKKTRLWLKGLPILMATDIVVPEKTLCPSYTSKFKGTEKNKGTASSSKLRAKTFPGVARAMAEQWAGKAGD